MNRSKLDGPESPIDAPDKLVDTSSEVLVFLDVLPGRNSQLDEYDLRTP